MGYLLPGRIIDLDLTSVVNHDDRAAPVCAFTALCVAADDFVAVGNGDGWIVLPPRRAIQGWAMSDLKTNAEAEQTVYERYERLSDAGIGGKIDDNFSIAAHNISQRVLI